LPCRNWGAAKVQTLPDDRVVINLGESPQGGSPGDPQLPYKLIRVLVPPDADLETVQAQLISGDWEQLPGEYEIAPAPPAAASAPVIDFCGKDPAVIVDGKDTAIYGKNAYFPAEPVEVVSVGLFRQWKLVEYRVWLAAYNPVKKKMRVLRNISTNLSVQPLPAVEAVGLSSPTPPVLPNTGKFTPELLEKIANPEDLETFYGPDGEVAAAGGEAPGLIPADYVIITTSTIVTNSTNMAAFITAKQTAGYTVKTVTEGAVTSDTTYVTGATCDQRADNIRSWLQANWASDGIQYVLLIGDPHPDTFSATTSIPMKWVWPRSTTTDPLDHKKCPTDMYFAELSNTWDMDLDGQYGEFVGDYGAGGCDKFCEVKVGRIPFYGSYVDLDSILQQAINYGSATGNLGWRQKVLIPAAVSNFGPQDNNGDGDASDAGDYSLSDRTFGADWGDDVKTLASSAGFSSYTLYERNGVYADGSAYPLNACDAALTNVNLINEWQNTYGFVTWWAHGAQQSASRFCWTSDPTFVNITGNQNPHLETTWLTLIDDTDCSSLDANFPSFVVQVSCNNGYPENASNLGYSILKEGGIATICGTRITWYALGSWNTGIGATSGDNASYGYYCFDNMAVSSSDTVGEALVNCKSSFGTGWASGSSWMNMVGLNLYGDPSLALGVTGDVKWEQKPDLTENGIDIRCDRDDGISRILADDFNCTTKGPITKVVLWGSWHDDIKGAIKKIHLSIHDDDPCGPMGWSEPNNLLWSRDFGPSEFNETPYASLIDPEWWWDPAGGSQPVFPGDYVVWQYDITIDSTNQFVQQGDPCNPIIYWLDVYVELEVDPQDPNIYEFGWKTRDIADGHFNDDAVWSSDNGDTWNELRYIPPHGYGGFPPDQTSIDMAFKIITGEPEEPSYIKWSQPPVEWYEPNVFVGWDEESHDWLPRMVADDFFCDTNRPVTAIRWWGSFLNWNQQVPPPQLPKAFYLTIWTDVPDPDPCEPDDYSHPNEIIWHNYCSCYDVKFVGWEFDPRSQEVTLPKFEFYQELDPCDYWYQPNDVNVYWLGISAVYGDMPDEPCYPWGWETREHFFQDDAVRFFGWPEPNISYSASEFEPIKLQEETWDLSFELISRPKIPPKPPVPHLKWSQPPIEREVNPYEMPVYWGWDEKSYNKDLQDPCGPWRIVADDFRCLGPMPITSIHWWGSHYDWEDVSQTPPASDLPTSWHIGFWSNVPAGADADYSFPRVLLQQFTVPAARVDVNQVGTDEFCGIYPYDVCYQYYVDLDPCEVFWQDDHNDMTQDSIFWLSIEAVYPDPCDPPDHPWGWKTRPWSWMDDAVTFNLQDMPVDGMALEPWQITPIEDPVIHESYDVAFELDTDPNYIKWEQPYDSIRHWPHYSDESSWASEDDETGELTYSRLVADDWKCERKTAVNAVAWWGSYIGYRSTPKHEGPWMTLPAKPDYFELRVWTDVPDPDPCDPANYSHPNEIVWEYRAYDYDEVFVGYDKHPHTAAHPNEPVFRYSVRLPDEERFKQPDVNDIYWLSVVAVYKEPRTPNYPWGWTNHEHVFNDDAVSGRPLPDDGGWEWLEIFDQIGESADMSFVLFTDPNQCNPCPDYDIDGTVDNLDLKVFTDNWLWTGLPGGFNDGDLNCDGEVTFYDYAIFALIWLDTCP